MAKKKEEQEQPAEGALATVAKAVGKAAGKVAKVAAAVEAAVVPSPAPKKVKIPKLAPKNKSRLPRKQKKALQKQNAARSK
jgi:hypothetical protein